MTAPVALVRRAERRDLARALELFEDLQRLQLPWWMFEPRPTLLREVQARYVAALEDPDGIHLVAELGGRVAGMGLGHLAVASRVSDEVALEISNVIVEPAYRGGGVARAIVAGLAAFARERGVTWLSLRTFPQNEGAVAFWAQLGFEPRIVQMVARADLPGFDV